MSNQKSQSHKRQENNTEWLDELINEISSNINEPNQDHDQRKEPKSKREQHPVDAYYECLSYCDINPKGIDQDCESICIERHLKGNLW